MGSADDWSKQLKQQIDAERWVSDFTAKTSAMNRAIIAEQAPLVWEELCAEFLKHCEAFNRCVKPERELVFCRTGDHDFCVHPDALEDVVVGHYDAETKYISIETKKGKKWFIPSAIHSGTGKIALFSGNPLKEMSPESIARDAIAESVLRNL
jgi:hypothetical protein